MNLNFPNSPDVNVCVELQQAYEAVERAENLLAEARKSSLSGSYLRNTPASGFWSPEVFRIFGLDWAEEAPPLDIWISMVLRPDFARTVAAAQKAFRERQDYETEFQVRLRDGSLKILHSRAHPVSDRFGYDFALMGVVTDITAETQAQAAINMAREELRRSFLTIESAELSTNLDEEARIFNLDQNARKIASLDYHGDN
jgi:PAS domain S-box-containing protein